jgi:hypothetical protein
MSRRLKEVVVLEYETIMSYRITRMLPQYLRRARAKPLRVTALLTTEAALKSRHIKTNSNL